MRFQEFEEHWEELILNDAVLMSSGGTPSMQRPEYWGGNIPFISASSMHDTVISNSHQYITIEGLKSGSKLIKKGNLLLLVRGSMLWKQIPICYNKVDVAFNQDVKGIVANDKTTSLFLLYWFKSKEAILKDMVTSTGIGAGKFDSNSLLSLSLLLPNKSEQSKISKTLWLIDERIQTQNKIIEELNVLKAAVTKRIFSGKLKFTDNRGNDFPKWEWKKLEDIGEFSGGGTPASSNSSFWSGNIPWISSSDLSENDIHSINITRFITESAIINSATKLFAAPVILIVSRVGVGKVAYSEKNLCTSQDFLNMHKFSCNGLFLTYLLSIEMKKAASSTQGTSIKGISSMEIKLKHIFLPCIAEQNKIADFLDTLDKKVDAESRVLQKLILQKQYLLQHLFI
ncbi:hypothetical protein G7092_16710 [Mucilaginibacter sp. HC2]|uniref:restriction endonuclease subunit S n=1 Tax=Mucilaginibacter inviolabilis TaxID=2714892 RepID=UPI0014092898|nr:restriction endonuclease subunit S [Mucilaginibacter inviolabilis]NHA05454.1 hypothetical protein [Mucilaginibacter inviolabilis]